MIFSIMLSTALSSLLSGPRALVIAFMLAMSVSSRAFVKEMATMKVNTKITKPITRIIRLLRAS